MNNHPMKKADVSVIDWMNCIWLTTLPSNCKLLAAYLRKFMNSNQDMAWPSYARMIEETGLSRGCIAKHLAILESEGWLSRESRSGLNTTYTAILPKQLADGVKNLTCSLSELVHQMNTTCSPDEHLPVHQMDTNKQSNKQVSKQCVSVEIIEKAFEHFWETWRACKKSVNTPNTSSKATTLDKFKKLFNAAYFAKNTQEQFRKEINSMCDYAKEGHKLDGFNPFINMQTGRFLSNKGWRD